VNGHRLLEVFKFVGSGKPPKAYVEVADADLVERRGEYLRLLYVALTRAKHRLVVWWNPPREKGGEQPLAKVLGNATGAGFYRVTYSEAGLAALRQLGAADLSKREHLSLDVAP
jgi:ATP-dependent exoDNAse (exonuclease V) beta subunit